MLEFIVLGQVPGTGFVITFSWVVAVMTVVIGLSSLRHEHNHHELEQQVEIEEITL